MCPRSGSNHEKFDHVVYGWPPKVVLGIPVFGKYCVVAVSDFVKSEKNDTF